MLIRLAAAFCALSVLLVGPVLAHEGHDHGGEPPDLPAELGVRAEARSPDFELVAVAHGRELLLTLDRFATNEPVGDARIALETPDGPADALPSGDGGYRLPAPWLVEGGHHDLAVSVSAGGATSTLTLDLDLPDAPAAPARVRDGSKPLAELRSHLAHQGPVGAAAGGFLLGLATIMLGRARMRAPGLALLALCLSLLIGGAALAHEGEDHDAPAVNGAALSHDAPLLERARRLPDGTVFLPKSTQHLLAIRTEVTAQATHRRTVTLTGRVIADPNASGIVQSSVGGRLSPPPGGFPNLGALVRRGDRLATVTPPVQAVDVSDMRQTQGDLDQQIAILTRRVARYEKLAPGGIVTQTALDDARAELSGLQDRRKALDAIRRESEELTAPVDGVIAERAAIAGQMAPAGSMVFRIVDPAKLVVEALSFEALEPGATASARLPDGKVLALVYRGEGLVDRNQAVPVQFAVEGGAQGLRLGQFVSVLAATGGSASGLALPRSSVLRSDGGAIVYEHVSAERFAARTVTIEPLDAEQVVVSAGLSSGRRVVTRGAELIDQVR